MDTRATPPLIPWLRRLNVARKLVTPALPGTSAAKEPLEGRHVGGRWPMADAVVKEMRPLAIGFIDGPLVDGLLI